MAEAKRDEALRFLERVLRYFEFEFDSLGFFLSLSLLSSLSISPPSLSVLFLSPSLFSRLSLSLHLSSGEGIRGRSRASLVDAERDV